MRADDAPTGVTSRERDDGVFVAPPVTLPEGAPAHGCDGERGDDVSRT
jgi:hypothetical protein